MYEYKLFIAQKEKEIKLIYIHKYVLVPVVQALLTLGLYQLAHSISLFIQSLLSMKWVFLLLRPAVGHIYAGMMMIV